MNNWISIEDRLPGNFEEVLFFAIADNGKTEIVKGHRDEDMWYHCCLFYSSICLNLDLVKITHWMLLPDRPK